MSPLSRSFSDWLLQQLGLYKINPCFAEYIYMLCMLVSRRQREPVYQQGCYSPTCSKLQLLGVKSMKMFNNTNNRKVNINGQWLKSNSWKTLWKHLVLNYWIKLKYAFWWTSKRHKYPNKVPTKLMIINGSVPGLTIDYLRGAWCCGCTTRHLYCGRHLGILFSMAADV